MQPQTGHEVHQLDNHSVHHPDNTLNDARVPQSDIASVYDRIAPLYNLWARLTESHARNRAIQLAAIANGEDILEVACGTGLCLYQMASLNPAGTNTGIDISPAMLTRARRRMRGLDQDNWSLSLGSAFELDQADQSIDLLMNNYMFDLIPFEDMDSALAEFRRVLKPGGRLVLANMTIGEKAGSRIFESLYNLNPRLMGGCRGVRMAGKLEHHGFKLLYREYVQQMLFPSEVILAKAVAGQKEACSKGAG
jgi:ubiquinone/menaquinone biosynthesis C-methylase UbiE